MVARAHPVSARSPPLLETVAGNTTAAMSECAVVDQFEPLGPFPSLPRCRAADRHPSRTCASRQGESRPRRPGRPLCTPELMKRES
jgi:hypothetical protein